jgi:pyruvate dehydrogenase E2 component (dihydrolipoamide acetyltransferase)
MNADVPSGWRAGSLRAGGVTLATYETGNRASAAGTVLLLHGLGHWTDAAWGRLVPRLDPALRYVAFDLPGFGASEKPAAAYDLLFFRRVTEDAVAAYGLDRVALVGHSLGGMIAADYASAHPSRVTHLALIAPAGFSRTPRFLLFALAGALAQRLFVPRPSRRFVARVLERGVVDATVLDPAHVERAYELTQEPALRRAYAGVYGGALRTIVNRRALHGGFARYTGPVFCAWGAQDRYIGIGALRNVQRVYPYLTTLVLEHSAHLPMIEEPDILGAALRAFLAS